MEAQVPLNIQVKSPDGGWGFIIYRCDYSNDTAWSTFIDRWTNDTKAKLINHRKGGREDIADTLLFTTVEDRETLEGATVEHVQERFTAWTESPEVAAEIKSDRAWHSARYEYCIHVDATALQSVVRYLEMSKEERDKVDAAVVLYKVEHHGFSLAPYFNIVTKKWEVFGEYTYSEEDLEEILLEQEYQNSLEEWEREEEDSVSIKVWWPSVLPDWYEGVNHRMFHAFSGYHNVMGGRNKYKLVVW